MLTFNLLEWQYFGLKEEQAPLILIQDGDSKKFLKDHIEADQIVSWLKEYFVSIALNFSALVIFCLISYDFRAHWSVLFVGWQVVTVQEVWAYSWGQQRAC